MSYFDSSTLLAAVSNVDLKSTGQTTLITVPDSNYLFITDVIIAITDADTVTVAPSVSVGKTAAWTEWIGVTTLTGLDAVGKFMPLANASTLPVHQSFYNGEVVKMDVRTGATATTLRATIYLFGYII